MAERVGEQIGKIIDQSIEEDDAMEDQPTTEGITREDVNQAMEHLGIWNPKPEIPLEVTVSGHEIVGISRRIRQLELAFESWQSEIDLMRRSLSQAGIAI